MNRNPIVVQIESLLHLILVDGRYRGYIRLVASIIMLLFLGFWSWNVQSSEIIFQPGWFNIRNMRYWIVSLAPFIAAILLGGRYIQDVFELPRLRDGMRVLLAGAFSLRQPVLRIKNGKKLLDRDKVNLLERAGGPGSVNVDPGSVVLVERLDRPSSVNGEGSHYISNLEHVKEIAALEDRAGMIESTFATTKDGIPVVVRDVRYRFRLRTGRKPGDHTRRTLSEPYPFSKHAMRNLVYNRNVGPEGIITWDEAVRGAIRGVIADYISSHKIDLLTAPGSAEMKDSRREIKDQLFARGARERLRKLGADLLWVDIGHFDIDLEGVDNQRVETWQAIWHGRGDVVRAHGEARHLAYRDLGRAEAQAEMLTAILESLNAADLSNDQGANLRTIMLARTAQILEAIASQDPSTSGPALLPPGEQAR